MTVEEKEEVVRRVAKRVRAEKCPIGGPRSRDIAAEELTKFYIERERGAIKWSPQPGLREALRMFVYAHVAYVKLKVAVALRRLATRVDGRV